MKKLCNFSKVFQLMGGGEVKKSNSGGLILEPVLLIITLYSHMVLLWNEMLYICHDMIG